MATASASQFPGSAIAFPVIASAFGKSLKFRAQTEDNYSAGKRSEWKNNRREYLDTPYSNSIGEIETTQLYFSNELPDEYFAALLPLTPSPSTNLFYAAINTYKSGAEQVNYSLQVHVVTDIPALVIGDQITENNPLIKTISERQFKGWALTKKISKFTQVIDSNSALEAGDGGFTITISVDATNKRFSMTFKTYAGIINYSGWAITDENGQLIIAENDVSKFGSQVGDYRSRTLHFNFNRTR